MPATIRSSRSVIADIPPPPGGADTVPVHHQVAAADRAKRTGHAGAVVWLTGLPGSGKSTLAMALERRLTDLGWQAYTLDGDNVRRGLNADLPKGHYKRARAGLLRDFTGVDAPYEAPEQPDIAVDTETQDVERSVAQLLEFVVARCRI